MLIIFTRNLQKRRTVNFYDSCVCVCWGGGECFFWLVFEYVCRHVIGSEFKLRLGVALVFGLLIFVGIFAKIFEKSQINWCNSRACAECFCGWCQVCLHVMLLDLKSR